MNHLLLIIIFLFPSEALCEEACEKTESHYGASSCSEERDETRQWNGADSLATANANNDDFQDSAASHPLRRLLSFEGVPLSKAEKLHRTLLKRITRSPMADQIRMWKDQLSGELQNAQILGGLPCNRALTEVCLKHISCRQLWNIFRTQCAVDSSNKCVMTKREECWQSFEGISWTGLGNCTCHDTNSDCHWIRFQTRYNKCIYEISLSRDIPSSLSFLRREPLPSEAASIPERYQISSDYFRPQPPDTVEAVTSRSMSLPSRSTSMPIFSAESSQGHGFSRHTSLRSTAVPLLIHPTSDVFEVRLRMAKGMHTTSQPILRKSTVEPPQLSYSHSPRTVETAPFGYSHPRKTDSTSESAPLQESGIETADERRMKSSRQKPDGYQLNPKYESRHSADSNNAINTQLRNDEPQTTTAHYRLDRGFETDRSEIRMRERPRPETATLPSPGDESSPERRYEHSRSDHIAKQRALHHVNHIYGSTSKQADPPARVTNTSAWNSATYAVGGTLKPPRERERLTNENADGSLIVADGQSDDGLSSMHHNQMKPKQTGREDKSPQRSISANVHLSGGGERSYNNRRPPGTDSWITTSKPVTAAPSPPTQQILDRSFAATVATVAKVATIDSALNATSSSQYSDAASLSADSNSSYHRPLDARLGDSDPQSSASDLRSSCETAHNRCDRFDTCKWHLSEVQIRCDDDCNRQQCAAAIQRLARFVPMPSVESLMFCYCEASDSECLAHQKVLYPRCLYSDRQIRPLTCTEAVAKCASDVHCQRQSAVLFERCPVQGGACVATELQLCMHALIEMRGSYLEYPCYCPQNDHSCRKHQYTMLPNNPCLERSTIEYNRLELRDEKLRNPGSSNAQFRFPPNSVSSKRKDSPSSASFSSQRQTTPDKNDIHSTLSRVSPDEKNFYESDDEAVSGRAKSEDLQPLEVAASSIPKDQVDELEPSARQQAIVSKEEGSSEKRTNKVSDGKRSSSELSSPRIVGSTFIAPTRPSEAKAKHPKKYRGSTTTSRPKVATTDSVRTDAQTTVRPTLTLNHPRRPSTIVSKPYVKPTPPPEGGCTTKDVNGNVITHLKESIIRRYHDWAGRCSMWCSCSEDEKLTCNELQCMPEQSCQAPLTRIEYGERLYLKNRGACTCLSSVFVCDQQEDFPKLDPGVYILVGYSLAEIAMLKQLVPKKVLEKAGLVSEEKSIAFDIGSRLQLALERHMPSDMQCRVMVYQQQRESGNIIFQMEWFGVNSLLNETTKRWHTGQAEKVCSPYVSRLADEISRNQAVRYELVLSTVKQIRLHDLLNKIPDSALPTFGSCKYSLLLFAVFAVLCS